MTGGVRLKNWEVVKRVRNHACIPIFRSLTLTLSQCRVSTDRPATVTSQPGPEAGFLGRVRSVPTGKSFSLSPLNQRANFTGRC